MQNDLQFLQLSLMHKKTQCAFNFHFDAEPDCPFFTGAFHSTRFLIPGIGVSFLFSVNMALISTFGMSKVLFLALTCRYAFPSVHSFTHRQILSWLRVERQAGFACGSD